MKTMIDLEELRNILKIEIKKLIPMYDENYGINILLDWEVEETIDRVINSLEKTVDFILLSFLLVDNLNDL